MREALTVIESQYALDLAEEVNGSHIQCAFVCRRRTGPDHPVTFALVWILPFASTHWKRSSQKSGDCLLVAIREGLGQVVVRLSERRRVIGSGKRPGR